MNKFFRYSGAKDKFTSIINYNIKTDKKIYCEPFIGSGAVLFNLNKEFDKYIVNDIDRNIIRIYKSFKNISYEYYKEVIDSVFKEFGRFTDDCRYISKEAGDVAKTNYYNFRNWFNSNHWNTDTELEGIYLHMLANSCINSMLRFGPNGMNQGFGLRFSELDQTTFNNIQNILQRTEIYNGSYKDLLKEDAFFFFDPPYASQASSYTGFSFQDQEEFLELIKDKEYLYTDILNEVNSKLQNRIVMREMVSTAPSSDKSKNTNIECLFSSYNLDNDW
jgi:DNA adenine methylase Dam